MNNAVYERSKNNNSSIPVALQRYFDDNLGHPWNEFPPQDVAHQASSDEIPVFFMDQPLNEILEPNQYLASINRILPEGGLLVGSANTSHGHWQKVAQHYGFPLRQLFFIAGRIMGHAHCHVNRLRRLYFNPERGRCWNMSEIEIWGRIFAAGFRLEKHIEDHGCVYFMAKKTSPAVEDLRGCSSLIIRLPRVGKGGKVITVYKLRTMYPYAQFLQEYVFEHNGLETCGKIKNDPRVTPAGRLLRKYFIDELPNLINLLRGDIKLFGVRPISSQYLSIYPESFQAYRKQFKPGMVPPEYVHLPKNFEQILESERVYLQACENKPLLTDLEYLSKAAFNIIFKGARSR